MRVRARFTKRGKVRFTSHRDLARMWERALRRAGTGDNQDSTTDLLSRDPSTAPTSTS